MQCHSSQVGWIFKTFANCYICMQAYLKKCFNAIDLSLTTATNSQNNVVWTWNDWNFFIQLTRFSSFAVLIFTFLLPSLLSFSYSITQPAYRKKANSELRVHLPIPLPSDSLLPSPLISCLSYLQNTPQTAHPLLEALQMDGSYEKQQEIVWNSHHHVSEGDRSPAPTSALKTEPKKNLFVPWWSSDYNQHTVIMTRFSMHC